MEQQKQLLFSKNSSSLYRETQQTRFIAFWSIFCEKTSIITVHSRDIIMFGFGVYVIPQTVIGYHIPHRSTPALQIKKKWYSETACAAL